MVAIAEFTFSPRSYLTSTISACAATCRCCPMSRHVYEVVHPDARPNVRVWAEKENELTDCADKCDEVNLMGGNGLQDKGIYMR